MPRVYGTAHSDDTGADEVAQSDSLTLRSRTILSVVIGIVAFCAVAAWSYGGAAAGANPLTVMDYNRIRADTAQIPGVAEACKRVTKNHLEEGEQEMRFAVFGFNSDTEVRRARFQHDPTKDFFVPLVEYAATDNWAEDWKVFQSVLPENDVAVGVFRFPMWERRKIVAEGEEPEEDVFGVMDLVITWKPEGVSHRELRRGGFFLPRVLVACEKEMGESFGASQHIALTDKDKSYYEVCESLAEADTDCSIEREFIDCPFDASLTGSPCKESVCSGADFEDIPGALSKGCCDYIQTQYCTFHEDAPGCHDMGRDIIDRICAVYENNPFEMEENIELMDFNECGSVIGAGGIMVRYFSNRMCKCVFENDKCFDKDLCKRDRSCSVEGVKTYKNCDPKQCRSACTQFKVATDSSTYCHGCPKLTEGYMCFPGAPGYKEFECCGKNPICNGPETKGDQMKCELFLQMGCAWGNTKTCEDHNQKQERVQDIMKILTTNTFDECQYGVDDWDGDGSQTCEDYAMFQRQYRDHSFVELAEGDECACCAACMDADHACQTKCGTAE